MELLSWHLTFNSLVPGRFKFKFWLLIFKPILVNAGWGISYEIALRWMPQDLTDDKSTLVQVMAWCHQATSHYLSQCWPRSLSSYGVTRPQWVKSSNCNLSGDDISDIQHIEACTKCLIFHQKHVSENLIDNNSALDQVVALSQTGNKQLPEQMMNQFANS